MFDIDDIYDELDFINQAAVTQQIEASASSVSEQHGAPAAGDQQFNAQVYKQSLLEKLNDRQAQAVGMPHVSTLVLAGAGSGKTSVLTARVAYLLADGIDPSQVMTVTFTNKASQEMRTRLNRILPRNEAADLWMGTFHSLCNRMLRESHKEAGLPKNFAILDTDGQEVMLKSIMRDAGLLPTKAERDAAKAASAIPDLLAADPLSGMGGDTAQPAAATPSKGATDDGDDDDEEDERRMKPSEVVSWINGKKERNIKPGEIEPLSPEDETRIQLYKAYQQTCSDQGLLDFSDLLHRCVELLEKDPMVRNRYRGKFKAILVDEFQDTNDVQYRWIQLLKSERAFVMAVGDDDQSIYAFRGANPENMKRFVDEMTVTASNPEGSVIKLEQNYRSLPYILDAANAVIDRNSNRLGKSLWSGKPDKGERILATEYENGYTEAQTVATRIHHLVRNEGVAPNEVAILYRTNTQSRLLEQELNKLSIPVTVYGGFRFYERQEVKNVLAYMDLVCSFERDISLSRVVNFPPRGIGERTIEDLRQESKENNVSMMEMIGLREQNGTVSGAVALRKQALLADFAGMMLGLSELAQTCKLSQLVEAVIEQSGIRKFYEEGGASAKKKTKAGGKGAKGAKSEEEERLDNISELVSAAAQFERDNPLLTTAAELLPEYLSFVQLMSSTSAADMDKKATVSLMTVHSSKGLEFDHVFITGMEEGIFPHARSIKEDEANGHGSQDADDAWVESMCDNDDLKAPGDEFTSSAGDGIDGPGIQEERRLMYVAMTRARKELQISHAKVRMVGKEEKETERSRFVLEIPKARIEFKKERDNKMDESWGRQDRGDKPSFVLGSSSRPNGQGNQGFKGFGRGGPNSGAREYGGDAFDDTRPAYAPNAARPARQDEPDHQVSRATQRVVAPQEHSQPPVSGSLPPRQPAPAQAASPTQAVHNEATADMAAVKTSWIKRRVATSMKPQQVQPSDVESTTATANPVIKQVPAPATQAPASKVPDAARPTQFMRRRTMR